MEFLQKFETSMIICEALWITFVIGMKIYTITKRINRQGKDFEKFLVAVCYPFAFAYILQMDLESIYDTLSKYTKFCHFWQMMAVFYIFITESKKYFKSSNIINNNVNQEVSSKKVWFLLPLIPMIIMTDTTIDMVSEIIIEAPIEFRLLNHIFGANWMLDDFQGQNTKIAPAA